MKVPYGGGVIMVPLLLYVPSLIGLETISMKTAAAITIVQSMAGSFSGLVVHKKNNFVHSKLITYIVVVLSLVHCWVLTSPSRFKGK
ncbi:TSUP family transporter [Desulfosporosinus sp. BG]|uniref:TSUP family transporter n=1 Tax=Desulfosporosinus sp. BG TaxID=1633135 RepID=UPI00114CEF4C|nr:TSUP family transporter [Desulfosporosinus sp. BG]